MTVDVALTAQCLDNRGPYWNETAWRGDSCASHPAAVLAFDAGAAMAGTGGALLTHTLTYKRDRSVYDRGRVLVTPMAGRGRLGVAVGGAF